ncbi:zinc ABC transporter substrate-binding protein [Microbacterium sp. NEAU-LLC]|uniref:Zinc ABC transporter substrate-binding protein n=1 Tax=Microbacterium helvum TaxID=2773713 RepID=A0ABR8NSZ6_9MICO|nr:zinc ABC transporter substrate-binding protein [Microbacterium helvum]MBD3943756.1 zinc ABC transporter substrate-binding protein [Microbacterium helvum]
MNDSRRLLTLLGLAAASTLVLAGCATSADAGTGGRLQVVASTNVYGQIASEIGGDAVDVTSIVSSASQDPHSFEPSARDQLIVKKADLIIENGGGYDAFVDGLIDSSGTEAPVITAAESSPEWPADADDHDDADHDEDHADEDHEGHDHIEGFNEHVWYDVDTIRAVAHEIADELGELDPDRAADFAANAKAFGADLDGLDAALADIESAHGGEQVFMTEPVPGYLVEDAGLVNVTPDAFSEAVEEEQDVAPATLLEALNLIRGGSVGVLITNTQTGGAETQAVVAAADEQGVPTIAFSETLPKGETYVSWMQANIEALSAALA